MADKKNLLLFAILPALIAGALALAPKVYDIVTTPKAKLTYEFVAGPLLDVDEHTQQIFAIRIANSGKRTLSEVVVLVSTPDGDIQAHSIQQNTGLEFTRESQRDSATYTVATLHPAEGFIVSLMLESRAGAAEPKISVRSSEVLGEVAAADTGDDRFNIDENIFGAALASLFVLVMTLSVALRRGPFFMFVSGIGGKQNILFFIAARLGLPDIANDMRLAEMNLTYLRMSDILLAYGISRDGEEREKTVKATKCMLLIKSMASSSLAVVQSNLQRLMGSDYSEEVFELIRLNSVSVDDQLKIRDLMDQLIDDEPAFLTWPEEIS